MKPCVAAIAVLLALGACASTPPMREDRVRSLTNKTFHDFDGDSPFEEDSAAPAVPPAPAWPSANSPPVRQAQPSSAEPRLAATFILKVTGMTCAIRCVREVREALLAVPGVTNAFPDWDTKRVTVHAAPGTDPDALVAALKPPYAGMLLEQY